MEKMTATELNNHYEEWRLSYGKEIHDILSNLSLRLHARLVESLKDDLNCQDSS